MSNGLWFQQLQHSKQRALNGEKKKKKKLEFVHTGANVVVCFTDYKQKDERKKKVELNERKKKRLSITRSTQCAQETQF